MSSVAILVPILNRPHRIEPLLQSIADSTTLPHRVVFAASDQPSIDELTRLGASFITDEGGDEGSYPRRINRLYAETTDPYLLLAADDLAFRPQWLEEAMKVMETLDGVVALNDQYNPAGVHFLVSRNYIETFGGCMDDSGVVLHEGYRHAYCDDEFRATARARGKWALAHSAVIEHLHVGAGKAPMDETYRIGEAAMPHDFGVFMSRAHLWNTGD